jgi:hypothetical protein
MTNNNDDADANDNKGQSTQYTCQPTNPHKTTATTKNAHAERERMADTPIVYNEATEQRLAGVERLAYLVATQQHDSAVALAEVLVLRQSSATAARRPEAYRAWCRAAAARIRAIAAPPAGGLSAAHLRCLRAVFATLGDEPARLACWRELLLLLLRVASSPPPNSIDELFAFARACVAARCPTKAQPALELALTCFGGPARERVVALMAWIDQQEATPATLDDFGFQATSVAKKKKKKSQHGAVSMAESQLEASLAED